MNKRIRAKTIRVLVLLLVLLLTLAEPASAVTTLQWDWKRAGDSIGKAISGMVQEKQEPEEQEPAWPEGWRELLTIREWHTDGWLSGWRRTP